MTPGCRFSISFYFGDRVAALSKAPEVSTSNCIIILVEGFADPLSDRPKGKRNEPVRTDEAPAGFVGDLEDVTEVVDELAHEELSVNVFEVTGRRGRRRRRRRRGRGCAVRSSLGWGQRRRYRESLAAKLCWSPGETRIFTNSAHSHVSTPAARQRRLTVGSGGRESRNKTPIPPSAILL